MAWILRGGVSFHAKNEEQNRAYNKAIEMVAKEHNLRPFHQVGSDNTTGYQGWDFWKLPTDESGNEHTIENLFEEIHTRAKEIIN